MNKEDLKNMIDGVDYSHGIPSLAGYLSKKVTDEEKGLALIKKFVEQYPNTEYPTVNDDLIEMFCKGARLLGIKYIILPTDDSICPNCKYVNGKIGKKGLSLHTLTGNNVLCHYCSYEQSQKHLLEHNSENCKHPSGKGLKREEYINEWRREDCEHFWESIEYSAP